MGKRIIDIIDRFPKGYGRFISQEERAKRSQYDKIEEKWVEDSSIPPHQVNFSNGQTLSIPRGFLYVYGIKYEK
jgi:hypothetical protein